MKYLCLVVALACSLVQTTGVGAAQMPRRNPGGPTVQDERNPRLPSGKMQRDEILKADYEKSLEDAAQLFKLAEELKIDLEKSDRYVLSIGTMKKTEEIEKLAKRIRSRMKRF